MDGDQQESGSIRAWQRRQNLMSTATGSLIRGGLTPESNVYTYRIKPKSSASLHGIGWFTLA